jgi:hypothetical protein
MICAELAERMLASTAASRGLVGNITIDFFKPAELVPKITEAQRNNSRTIKNEGIRIYIPEKK